MIKTSIISILLLLLNISMCQAFEFNFNSDKLIDDIKNKASDITTYTKEKYKDIKKV